MADELRTICLERRRAEYVVGMNVGHHHVLDRQLSCLPNGRSQALAVDQTSPGVHDRNSVPSNDEPDVGNRVVVLGSRVLIDASPDVDSWRNLVRDKRADVGGGLPHSSAASSRRGVLHEHPPYLFACVQACLACKRRHTFFEPFLRSASPEAI